MEQLQYVIEDSTIAELLGNQNFTTDESAILEIVKNAYDAKAPNVHLEFTDRKLSIIDTGDGMNKEDIKQHWMHVGKSSKGYEVVDENNSKRVLAGSKGIGRFALARLGKHVTLYSKKEKCVGVIWETDWNHSTLQDAPSLSQTGTTIVIEELREKWTKKKVQGLILFLSKTYNDTAMSISISHPSISGIVPPYFPKAEIGKNCLSTIKIEYSCDTGLLDTEIHSDEFLETAKDYCKDIDLNYYHSKRMMIDELKDSPVIDASSTELQNLLTKIGSFSANFFFSINPTKVDAEKFLYKHRNLPESIPEGVVLYRNAFSISSYEGKKDWLGFGKRSRKSPAAASHPTGAWRVRENQIAGKVEIDKDKNSVLNDLSNRQGLEENVFYYLFIEIILAGICEFERYRQNIIRHINQKNVPEISEKNTPISDKIMSNPKAATQLSIDGAKQLAAEIKSYRQEASDARREIVDVENRYKYDIRILNVLATEGLKASSIAHEMRNDRNSISDNTTKAIEALKAYDMWEELASPDKTSKSYMNVPFLLESNQKASKKLVTFMNTMLAETEKQQFEVKWQSVADILKRIKKNWERDYAWIFISLCLDEDICFSTSEDSLQVIFDNLILNSIQQNDDTKPLSIKISVQQVGNYLHFRYEDNGVGLPEKFKDNRWRILEVHETSREKGHGLGMWIVNNTVVLSGGEVKEIGEPPGFSIVFTLGGSI